MRGFGTWDLGFGIWDLGFRGPGAGGERDSFRWVAGLILRWFRFLGRETFSPFPCIAFAAFGLYFRRVAKVYFYYAAMNAGKSTLLLQSSYNYQERGMQTLLFTPAIDTRFGAGKITSRIGLEAPAVSFTPADNLFACVEKEHQLRTLSCVLVDEAQFLTTAQVRQLTDVSDQLDLPVLCYGLRTDFQGNLFEGSAALLGWADDLTEIKTICHCGRKATMVLRLDQQGRPIRQGAQVEIGGNDRYVSVCRRHFKTGETK